MQLRYQYEAPTSEFESIVLCSNTCLRVLSKQLLLKEKRTQDDLNVSCVFQRGTKTTVLWLFYDSE